jgi:ribonucleoside-diphosphate reductase alpha chain
VYDYAWKFYGVKGITADEVDAKTHVKVLAAAQKYVDSSVSKTCNVGSSVTYDEFRKLYMMAWRMGVKGMTTFRAAGKRFGIFKPVEDTPKAVACEIDPVSGHKTCGD